MQKQLFSFTLFLVIAFVFVTGCGKDDNPVVVKTKTQLVSQNTWRFSSATASGTDVSNQDPPFAACRKDNILTFAVGGSGNVNEGPTSCNPAENNSFTWNFASSETILHVSIALYPNAPNDFTIVSLTETNLIVSFPYTPPAGPSIQIVITFIH